MTFEKIDIREDIKLPARIRAFAPRWLQRYCALIWEEAEQVKKERDDCQKLAVDITRDEMAWGFTEHTLREELRIAQSHLTQAEEALDRCKCLLVLEVCLPFVPDAEVKAIKAALSGDKP